MDVVSCADVMAGGWDATALPAVEGVGHVFEAGQYRRPLPAAITSTNPDVPGQIRSFYTGLGLDVQVEPAVLVRVRDACIYRSVIYADCAAAPRIVHETYRPNDQPWTGLASAADLAATATEAQDGCEWLYLGSVGSSNYGHWLIDDLPRLEAFGSIRRRHPSAHIRIVLPDFAEPMNGVRIQGIRDFLGAEGNYSVQLVDPFRILRLSRLYYCTPVSRHPVAKSPAALQAVRRRLTPAPGQAASAIFIDRQRHRARNMVNTGEIRFRLEMLGFRSVDPETMPFAEQVSTFSSADRVVGCMGAAMTNTVFCPAGARILHLVPEGWMEPFYWDLSATCGHRFGACYGAVTEANPHHHLSSFAIEWARLLDGWKALDAP